MAHVQTAHPSPSRAPAPSAPGSGVFAGIPAPAAARSGSRQRAITIVADVRRTRLPALRRTLASIGADPANNAVLPFAALPRTHFAQILVLDPYEGADGAPIAPHLVYMADVDEPAQAESALGRCLEELVDVAGDGLDAVFGACVGYPPPSRATPALRLAFLRAHAVGAAAAYVNTVGRGVRQILQEDQLRVAIRDELDRRGAELGELEPAEVRAAIKRFVSGRAELAWALTPPPPASLTDRVKDTAHLLALPAGVLALSPVIAAALPLYALALRRQERSDPDPHIPPTRDHVRVLAEAEDHGPQNQFSAVGFLKPGRLRRLTAEVVTRGIDYAARHVYGRANLAGVKTIHCARWVWLDDHRRLIFASNYDGSLESYNDDFVDKVWWGLNAVFSNGVGWPRTNWLFFDGARQEQAFKDWLRRHQVPTQVWYSAYPHLTALNIENNARIRAGLHEEGMSGKEAEQWLRRI